MTYNSIRFDINLQNFKKPVDIFERLPQIRRKRSKEYLVMILDVKRKL